MKIKGLTVLRLGLGITFLWIGVRIFQSPQNWASLLQDYFVKYLPVSPVSFMKINSYVDVALGLLLILNKFTKLVVAICALQLIGILVACSVTDITVRDIGLLGASLGLFLDTKGRLFKS